MCKHCPGVEDCAHDRETDTWLSRDLTPRFLPPLAPVEAPQAPGDPSARERRSEAILAPEPTHGPALTRNGFTEALGALGRDGGEPDRCGRGSCCLLDGHEGRCER